MRVLDLFSGSGSVEKYTSRFPDEFTVVSVDNQAEVLGHVATHCVDILEWDYAAIYKPGDFDFVWASPPCEQYSVARTTAKTPRNLVLADALSAKALEIITYFAPKYFVIENPRSSMLWKRPHMTHLTTYVGDYCRYGMPYQKPTRFACNVPLVLDTCRQQNRCDNMMTGKEVATVLANPLPPCFLKYRTQKTVPIWHVARIGWMNRSSVFESRRNLASGQSKYAIVSQVPPKLIESIFDQCKATVL
jgi:hypothetical protein